MATATRALWKGAISFGLVHIPVSLHPAAPASASGVDFDWLDKRSMDPVGYKRINKRTGKEIDKDDIVRGVETGSGEYVVLGDDEIAAAYPRTTQTIEIEAFVKADEVPFVYLERPYYLAAQPKGEKVYALFREALRRSGRIGIARVVIQTKQHLAALVPDGPALVLDLLRWGQDVRDWKELDLPPVGLQANRLGERELAMAEQLIEQLSAKWDPDKYRDTFREQVMKLVERKVKAGKTEEVLQPEEEAPGKGAEVIDLTELLRKSLHGDGKGARKANARATAQDAGDAGARKAGDGAVKAPARAKARRPAQAGHADRRKSA